MKRCVVNVYSQGREQYERLSQRLVQNLKDINFDGDILLFSPLITENRIEEFNNKSIIFNSGWPSCNSHGQSLSHVEANHQFKSYAIQHAREKGYEQVIWMDSTTQIIKDPTKYFLLINDIGALTFNAGDILKESEWTSDVCLEIMGCSAEYGMTFSQCASGVMMFDFNTKIANDIQDEFIRLCSIPDALNMSFGSSRKEFKAHRSDQSIITFVMKKYRLGNLPYGGFIDYPTYMSYGFIYKWSPTFLSRNL